MSNVILQEFRIEARHAPLLVAPNDLFAYLAAQCADAMKTGRLVATVMVNLGRTDRLGAHVRDPRSEHLMREIVATIGPMLRSIDRYAVVSHEEVWIVLPDLAHIEIVSVAASRMLAVLDATFGAAGRARRAKPCIGAAVFPLHAPTVSRLLECTEQAMRAAQTDDSRCTLFQASIATAAHDVDLEHELRDAILGNHIEVRYQPQIDIVTGECVSAEALLRMTHADGTPAAPIDLVEIAERTEIIHPLTHLILGMALRHLKDFEHAGWRGGVSVNLSARLLGNDDLPDQVGQLLETWGVKPSRLTLEITETGFVTDVKRSVRLLSRLRKMGVRLAMDDFGTGYSSLAQFRELPLNEVKIDQLFIRNMQVSVGDRQIVRTMIDLARNFGLQTVAEGVQDQMTLDCLREMQCDLGQGFLFSPALPRGEFVAWVEARDRVREASDAIV